MGTHTILSELTPGNCIFILLNFQMKLAFTINSNALPAFIDNAVDLAKIATTFEIPIILTTIGADTFGGPLLSHLQAALPDHNPINCNKLSIWENRRISASHSRSIIQVKGNDGVIRYGCGGRRQI